MCTARWPQSWSEKEWRMWDGPCRCLLLRHSAFLWVCTRRGVFSSQSWEISPHYVWCSISRRTAWFGFCFVATFSVHLSLCTCNSLSSFSKCFLAGSTPPLYSPQGLPPINELSLPPFLVSISTSTETVLSASNVFSAMLYRVLLVILAAIVSATKLVSAVPTALAVFSSGNLQ